MSFTWKVVKIIDEYNIVVNAGFEDDIEKEDKLEIYIPGTEVIDPDTLESLGTLDSIKAYLVVKHVFARMCICQNAETKVVSIIDFSANFSREETKPLNIDSMQISGGLDKADRKIRIGDLVRRSDY
ncbi:hypothetical protein [Brevibacillus invocatus]|uniref:hypothetical protein n=1 Tax=Brevibacillus invocatus TaxID=173959 RepID=UPI00203F0E14|nr:hypothetical protein [Brevibacillus invocatus]MCM3079606.1 hypothetical protein [Brevibacillus invocatus]MCM3429804.1 hypothetical protein [Brevibacillus invocatus]